MNADQEMLRERLVNQLSALEKQLDSNIDDVDFLSDVQEGIGRILSDGHASEADVRRVIQERYESGNLRKETFQLVKSMLDRYVTEIIETSPSIAEAAELLEKGTASFKALANPRTSENVAAGAGLDATMVIQNKQAATPSDPDGRVQVGSVLRDRFTLQERVSGESMGVVYKALDRRLAETGSEEPWVAIKVLAPQLAQNGNALRALQQEAAKGRSLVHPNIVRFIDLDREDELYFIVMEWLEGRTLAEILDSPDGRNISLDRTIDIVRQVGKALVYAHERGIVHADVKPGNIMILPNGDAKVFDFGIARVRQQQIDHDPELDPALLGLMTPAYSSMQVLTGEVPVAADDVFSLACLAYRLIAGFRVFGPRNAAEASQDGMKPQRPDGLSDSQWRAIKKALSYSRVTRFESVSDFLAALGDNEHAKSAPVEMAAAARFSEISATGAPSRWIIGLVVAAALGTVAANQMGYLDDFKSHYRANASTPEIQSGPALEDFPFEEYPAVAEEVAVAEAPEPPREESGSAEQTSTEPDVSGDASERSLRAATETATNKADVLEAAQSTATPKVSEAEPEVVREPLIDFSKLPPPTATLAISQGDGGPNSRSITLREDGASATIDLIRSTVDAPLTVRVEEVSYSGNRSPWAAAEFSLSDGGFVEFPAGQHRARLKLEMTSDDTREADQQVTLRVRISDTPGPELATINLTLEDDDQRVFEATLPDNTVAFTSSQVTVREQDPAVQLDIIRFNPDDSPLVVGYSLRDITATQGQDYFAPGRYTVQFGPGQRAARLLIPLVQDSVYEDNEAFSVELSIAGSDVDTEIYRRVAVLIRDDDQ
jgi:serine/threonine protein kinase